MDSYSVNEAAAVLGIPEGRVWELLARGVLAGSTEVGGDMRVVLRGATLPDAANAPAPNGLRHDTNGGNGENGGGHGELTPFRELLTEFRNLTERYGQALLALGESRGEVAALRGRVDLLEARIEHRLPWTEAPPAGWNAEALPEPEATQPDEAEPVEPDDLSSVDALPPDDVVDAEPKESVVDEAVAAELGDLADTEAGASLADAPLAEAPRTEEPLTEESQTDEAPVDEPPAEQTRPHRTRSRSREAVSGFAEALARAEDPTTAEVLDGEEPLPGAEDIADAIAAYRDEVAADVAPVVRAGYSTATPEPDWIAEEDLVVIAAPVPDDLRAANLGASEPEAIEPEAILADEVMAEEIVAEQILADEAEAEAESAELAAPDEELAASAPRVEPVEAPALQPDPDEPDEDQPPPTSDSDYAWLDEEPEAAPAPQIAAIAIGEPEAPTGVAEAATPEQPLARTPIEIAAEPPASDDVALLVGPAAFSEPPQIPREPAFWEAGARARAPFAVPRMDAWEASASEAMRVATEPEASVEAPAPGATPRETPSPATGRSDAAWPEVEVGWGSTPEASGPISSEWSPSETSASAAPAPARPKPAVRRRRGPAARAIRRLRILLD